MADALGKNEDDGENAPWLAFWLARPLPVLHSTKVAIAQFATRAETARIDEIVALVLRDPLLTAHALRSINMRERGALATDVVSIESTILLMGVDAFIHQFSALPEIEEILLPKHPQAYAALVREVVIARLGARLARTLGVMRFDARLDEIYITALLANLPVMLRIIEAGLQQKAPPVEPGLIALQLFTRWHLPEVFSTLLDASGGTTQRAILQQAVLRLADRLQLGWWQAGIEEDLVIAAGTLGVDTQTVWNEVTSAMLHFANNDWPYPQLFPPARWLPMLPGEWPDETKKVEKSAKPSFADYCREIHRAGDTNASFNQIMSLTIRALAEGVGLDRISFLLLMAGQNALKTRYVVGAEVTDPLRAMMLDLNAPHLITKLMLKQQAFWLSAANRGQYERLIPRPMLQAVGDTEFFVMSLMVEDKPVGLFFADCKGKALIEAQYTAFKQVCLLTAQALTTQAKRLSLGE